MQDLTKGTERRIVPKASQQESFDAAIFPDGSQIVYERTVGQVPMNSRSELYVIGADGSSPHLLLGGKQGEILMLSAVSPDGRQLTYFLGKMEGDGIHGDLYVIDADGSNPRLLASGEKNEIPLSTIWSPDGKHLLVWAIRDDLGGNSRILLVSVAEGSSKVIGLGTGFGQFSPDGRYISFYRWPDFSSGFQGGIYIAPADGGKEVLLFGGEASDPRWTPDGKRIVFRDQRPDQSTTRTFFTNGQEPCDFYSIGVVDGKPQEKPVLLQKDVELGIPFAYAKTGDYYYTKTTSKRDAYIVNLDPANGKVASKPERLNQTFVGSTVGPPRWSPDGKFLSYARNFKTYKRQVIRSMITGEERELAPSPPFHEPVYEIIQWFADGRFVLANDFRWGNHCFYRRVEVQTGKHSIFFDRPGVETLGYLPVLSHDEKTLFYSLCSTEWDGTTPTIPNTLRLMRRDLASGDEKELYSTQSTSRDLGLLLLSPDGEQVAFKVVDEKGMVALLAVPANGGSPRILAQSRQIRGPSAWTMDGSHLLVAQLDASSGQQQLWSYPAEGGEPAPAGLTMPELGAASVHPGGRTLAIIGGFTQTELWVMKLLPPGAKPSR